MTKKVLFVTHAHPDFSKGGGEIAAYNLFQAQRELPGWDAHFLARHELSALKRVRSSLVRHNDDHETLFANETDPFSFSVSNPRRIMPAFRAYLQRLRPDVVHFHHYWQVGLELFAEVKRYSRNVPVVLTLHEFLAVCHQNGQMLKTNGELCRKSSPAECHACMPDRTPRDYFLRKRHVQSFFLHFVDHFVSPSAFLRQRYVEWGISAERISVIENCLPTNGAPIDQYGGLGEAGKIRFGFFGQINPFKGVDVLLEAVGHLSGVLQDKISIEIHGGNLALQSREFRTRFNKLLARAPKCVRHCGAYSQRDLPQLMGQMDWIIVPSIWWENSPLVIQEAFKFKRPVICADIGGMAEKVDHNRTGLHFRVGSPLDLARRIEQIVADPSLGRRLQANIPPPISSHDCALRHTELYELLITQHTQSTSVAPT